MAGTSLAVYPAASLVRYVRPGVPVFVIDPGNPDISLIRNPVTVIRKNFPEGMAEAVEWIKHNYNS